MRDKLLTGLLAAVAAVVLPLLMCGMMPKDAVETESAAPSPGVESPGPSPVQEVSPSPSQRTVSAIIVHQNAEPSAQMEAPQGDAAVEVTVEVSGQPTAMTLEDYLVGVLMGEMPASYPLEALKAQAVAARTYTLRRMDQGGVLSDDPAVCQAYIPISQAQEKWGADWETYLQKLRQAVEETSGQVLTYGGELIAATYFACSGGRTESAQAVWGGAVPYLVSVDSPGEEDASSFSSTVTLDKTELMETLGVESVGVSAVTYTEGGGVDTMTIGGKTFTGVELRELLGLKSTRFTMEVAADTVTFSVQGFGHRVGMSQNGARVMAEAGSSYEDILRWYYTGVELETR